MKCARCMLSLLLAVLAGGVIALGSADAHVCPASAPGTPCLADPSPQDDLGAMPSDHADQAEEADYFDRGEETAVADKPQGNAPEAQPNYRYEYPEQSAAFGPSGRMGMQPDFGEQYYYKYGYQYANPAEKYGAPGEAASPANASPSAPSQPQVASETPVASDRSAGEMDAEFSECYEGAAAQETAPAAEESAAVDEDAAEEASDEEALEEEFNEEPAESQGSAAEKTTTQDDSAAMEEFALELEAAFDESTGQEPASDAAEHQFDRCHPRYGIDYANTYGCEGYQPPAGNASTAPAAQSPASPAAPPAQPSSVESRYGYPEYMGEDYFSEADDDSIDEEQTADEQEMTEAGETPADDTDDQPSIEDSASAEAAEAPANEEAPVTEENPGQMPSSPENPDAASAPSEIPGDNLEYHYGRHGYMDQPTMTEETAPVEASSSYEFADPYGKLGNDFSRSTQDLESGIELFAYRPDELLSTSDQDLLRTLASLCEEPSGTRRSTLNNYLESQGMEAVDFASRYEDTTGMEVLGLADDLPGAAALLAVYRLVEQGELGVEEGVDLLRRSLERFSPDWLQGVNEITARAFEGQSDSLPTEAPEPVGMNTAPRHLAGALWVLAANSAHEVGRWAVSLSDEVSKSDWAKRLPQMGLARLNAYLSRNGQRF